MCTRRLSGLCLCEILEARRGMASQTTSLLILLIIASADVSSYSPYSPIVLPNLSLTATEGSCVEINCTVTGTLADEDALWFWMKDGKWNETEKEFYGTIVYSNKITEQPISPSFEGRVTYTGSQRLAHLAGSENNPLCSILICDLKIKDSGIYFIRYLPKDPTQKWKTVNDVVLTVQENRCPITFNEPEPVMASSTITLRCSTVGSCSSDLYIKSVPLSGFETLTSTSDRRSATLSFRASWKDDGREFTCQTKWNKDIHLAKKTTVTVQYAPSVKVKVISPSSSFTQGQRVTFTCEVIRSNPPPDVYTWFKNGNSFSSGQTYVKTLQPEDSGSYTCSATNTVAVGRSSPLQMNVLWKLEIMNTSGCVYQSEVLTCVCISRGSPLPTVTWSLLETHTEYSVVTMVTGRTVNSTFVLQVNDHNRTEVQCVSSNRVGQVQESFRPTIRTNPTEPQGFLTQNGPIPVILVTVSVVSLVLNFILIAIFLFQRFSNKKKKPNPEDRLYASLQKTNMSSEYEVITLPFNT